MHHFLTKKTAAVAVLLVVAGAAYAETCTKCYCINWGGGKVCFCASCQNID
jgi:hypothetical protein